MTNASDDRAVSAHYEHGGLLAAIETALGQLGKSADAVTVADLAPVDEFHIGGRTATEDLLDQLHFTGESHVLDVGCGLGGAARFTASRYGSRVSGIDLTDEYITAGRALCAWVGLAEKISLQQGSALALPFEDASFDGAYLIHVGMNIEDKARLFAEVRRVLRPGAHFGIYDIMRVGPGQLTFPVPWAAGEDTNHLASPEQYSRALGDAGFDIECENNRYQFAVDFFQALKARNEAGAGPGPLGLHTLMQASTATKIGNMVDNLAAGYVAPVEIVARTP
jgi:SAM-dependent methyltransferase